MQDPQNKRRLQRLQHAALGVELARPPAAAAVIAAVDLRSVHADYCIATRKHASALHRYHPKWAVRDSVDPASVVHGDARRFCFTYIYIYMLYNQSSIDLSTSHRCWFVFDAVQVTCILPVYTRNKTLRRPDIDNCALRCVYLTPIVHTRKV